MTTRDRALIVLALTYAAGQIGDLRTAYAADDEDWDNGVIEFSEGRMPAPTEDELRFLALKVAGMPADDVSVTKERNGVS